MCNPDLSTEDEVIASFAEYIRGPFNHSTIIAETLDSLDIVGIVFDLEVCFDITIPTEEFSRTTTIKDFIEIVKKVRGH